MKAVIDLGTNTFHLLIAEITVQGFNEVFQKQIPVKIGAGGINKGFISAEAFARGMNALEEFAEILSNYPIESIVATGTSAIRNAGNGEEFMAEAKQRFGFTIESISGEEEAELIYKGVSMSFDLPDEPVLIMDIGGGSVEFIIGKRSQIFWKQSFEIGAARLLERFSPSDPITPTEIITIEKYLHEKLQPLKEALAQTEKTEAKIGLMIGSAGCFESLLDVLKMDLGVSCKSLSLYAHRVSSKDIDSFCGLILASKVNEREQLKGLLDFRVDMIVVATLLFRFVLSEFKIPRLIASNFALKEGLLFR